MNSDLNHYMRKTDITRAIVDGIPGRAICGEIFLPSHQGSEAMPGSEAASSKLEVCGECVRIYDGLRGGQEAKIRNSNANGFDDEGIRREFQRIVESIGQEVTC